MDGAALSLAGEGARPGAGALRRLAATLGDPRGATRPEIEQAGEGRLLAYAVVGSLIHTLAALGAGAVLAPPEIARDPAGWAAATLAGGLFVRPIALYGVAAAVAAVCRLAGGSGGWRATRAALFWTGLAAAPAALVLTLLGALAERAGLDGAAGAGGGLGALFWALLLAPALAEAHAFRRAWAVLAALALAALALAALAAL